MRLARCGLAVSAVCLLLGCNRILGIEKLQPAPSDGHAGSSGGTSSQLDAGVPLPGADSGGAGAPATAGTSAAGSGKGGSGGAAVAGHGGSGGRGGTTAPVDAGAGTTATDAGGQESTDDDDGGT